MLDRFEVYRAMWAAVARREAENRRAGRPPLTLDEKFFWGSEAAYRLLERDVMATQALLDDYQVPRQDAAGRRLTLQQRVGHFVEVAATAPLIAAPGGSTSALPTRPDHPGPAAPTLLDLLPAASQDQWEEALCRLLPDPHRPPDRTPRQGRLNARLAPPFPPGPVPTAVPRLAAVSRPPPRRRRRAARTVGTVVVVLLVVLVGTAAFASAHPRHGLSRWAAARAVQAGVSPHRLLLWDRPALVPAHDRILLTLIRIWRWLVGLAPRRARWRMQAAGQGAWSTISGYIRGTLIIAVFHGVVIGLALFLIGVPLVIPLALIVFLGSFIPIVGAVIAGTLAVGVALVSKGVIAALVVFSVLILENQAEGHLLQPFVVGRYVRLHPLAIAVVLAGGGFLQGIPGAIIAVPFVAAVTNAVRSVRQVGEQQPDPATDPPPAEEASPT